MIGYKVSRFDLNKKYIPNDNNQGIDKIRHLVQLNENGNRIASYIDFHFGYSYSGNIFNIALEHAKTAGRSSWKLLDQLQLVEDMATGYAVISEKNLLS